MTTGSVLLPESDAVIVITARKRSSGQGNIFRSVCQEFCPRGGGLPQCMLGCPPAKETPPSQGDPPAKETHPLPRRPLLPVPHPREKLMGNRSRPTPKGEIEEDQIQAHTQGGN